MRYRRLSYRYALVLANARQPLGEAWPDERWGVRLARTGWNPAADVYETADTVVVTIELAGVDQEGLDVLLYEDALVVAGQRRLPPAEAEGLYHQAEIRQGPFRLELGLPAAIDAERVDARYERGLLQLTLPKTQWR